MEINYDVNMIKFIKGFANKDNVKVVNDYLVPLPKFASKDVSYLGFIRGEHETARMIEDPIVAKAMTDLEEQVRNYLEYEYFPTRNLKQITLKWSRGLELIRWSEWAVLGPHSDGPSDAPLFPEINIGCLIYLNDDFNGGQIKFNDYDLIFDPEPGDLIIFPNHYTHEVLMVSAKDPEFTRRHTMPMFYSFTVDFS